MIYKKENPIGLDAKIQAIQSLLYLRLLEKWGLTENDFDAYGRVYINRSQNKSIPEAYIGKNEYRNVLVAEKSKMFFILRETQTAENALQYSTTVELCFIVDLKKLKPNVIHRADNEVHIDVRESFRGVTNVNITSLETQISRVFNGLTYKDADNLEPYHCFKYNINMLYFIDETCNCKC